MTDLDIIMEKVNDAAVFILLLPIGLLLRLFKDSEGSTIDDNLDRM